MNCRSVYQSCRPFLLKSHFFLLILMLPPYSQADISITAEAVLGKLVVMQINGKREKLRVGETKKNIKVLQADPNYVEVLINGKQQRIKVGAAAVTSNYSLSKKIERIGRNNFGMYMTTGTINQRTTNFLVDTGATFVSLSPAHAKALSLDYKNGRPLKLSTANGVIDAYMLKLKTVSIGGITINQVEAVVGGDMPEILLGMSFLNRIDVSYKNGVMTMESK